MQKISPFFWFNNNAVEAANFYVSIFKNSNIEFTSPMLTAFKLNGQSFTALNGGNKFELNQSISLMVHCNTSEEVEAIWEKISADGKVLMALNSYPWSEKYGWCQDKFGLGWQIIKHDVGEQKIIPTLVFVGNQFGNGAIAIDFYTSIFKETSIVSKSLYDDNTPFVGKLLHSNFKIENYNIIAMDGPGNHEFAFNEAFSFVIHCTTQEEVDYYWQALTTNGGQESQCAWCKDKFGVSWQVVPTRLMELMSIPDKEKASKVMQAMLLMKKIIIADLEKAAL